MCARVCWVQAELSMAGVLGLLVGLVKDLRTEFVEQLPAVVAASVGLLSAGGDKSPETLEAVFQMLGFVFKYTQRQMAAYLPAALAVTLSLRHQRHRCVCGLLSLSLSLSLYFIRSRWATCADVRLTPVVCCVCVGCRQLGAAVRGGGGGIPVPQCTGRGAARGCAGATAGGGRPSTRVIRAADGRPPSTCRGGAVARRTRGCVSAGNTSGCPLYACSLSVSAHLAPPLTHGPHSPPS